MPRGARSGASSSAQSRSTSATGSRRTNNAPAPPQPPPPADPPSASTTDQQPSWSSLSAAVQDVLRIVSSAASDRDANQRYRQPKDVELQEAKRALQWLHEQLLSPADPSAPSSSVPAPGAAGALDGPVTRADCERLLARFHALESAVLQSANPPPTRPDATINNRNPPPGTRVAASAARVASQQLRQRQAPRPRLRNRILLNVRRLPPHHPARTKSSLRLLLALKDPIFRGEGVMPLSVEKLRSGDIGINFANQMEVEQLLVSASERWIAEAFPNQEQQPVLREPTYTQLLTVVIHGVPYASGDGEPLAEALTAANNITFINTRFLSAPARRSAHPDGFGSVLVLCEDPATKAAALDRGKLGYNNQPHTVTDYRPSLRLQQCGHCQQFGHVARHCRRAPVCRLCAGKHPTSNHPPCQACKDSPSSACGQHSLKCANCADSHMANDEQCAHRRAWRDALADNDAQA